MTKFIVFSSSFDHQSTLHVEAQDETEAKRIYEVTIPFEDQHEHCYVLNVDTYNGPIPLRWKGNGYMHISRGFTYPSLYY